MMIMFKLILIMMMTIPTLRHITMGKKRFTLTLSNQRNKITIQKGKKGKKKLKMIRIIIKMLKKGITKKNRAKKTNQ